MNPEKYYITVSEYECRVLENLLIKHVGGYSLLSQDISNGAGTSLYSAYLTTDQALIIKLSCPVIGFLNFGKTVGKLVGNCK